VAGSCVLSLANRIRSTKFSAITDGAGAAITPASGFSVADLYDGTVERTCRLSAASSHQIVVSFTDNEAFTSGGAFDLVPGSGASISSVAWYNGATNLLATTLVAYLPMNSRGDGWRTWNAPTAQKHWRIVVTLTASATLTIGELWLGQHVTLPKTFSTITRSPQRHTVVNVSSAGARRRARFGPKQESFGLDFAPLSEGQDDAVLAVIDAADGAYSEIVLRPDTERLTDVYFGTIEDQTSASEDASHLRMGRSLLFSESGRSL
jgi:hypothetical protein